MTILKKEEIDQKIREFYNQYPDFGDDELPAYEKWLNTIDSLQIIPSHKRQKVVIKVCLDDLVKIAKEETKMFSDYLILEMVIAYKYARVNYITYFE